MLIIYLEYISFIIVSDNDTQMYETHNVIKGQKTELTHNTRYYLTTFQNAYIFLS